MSTRCTADETPSKKRKVATELTSDSEGEIGTESSCPQVFQPLHLTSCWMEPGSTTKCLTVAIMLPSGVGAGQFSLRVLEGGRQLEIIVNWPAPLVDLSMMHRKWLTAAGPEKIESYHPKLTGFENALKAYREHCKDDVVSTARISLPFQVETHIHAKYNLGWRDSTARMVYVDLKGHEEHYSLVQDENTFEIS